MRRFITIVGAMLLLTACGHNNGLPAVGSDAYRQLCASFYLGLSALQSGEDVNARKGLTRATEIAPGEPASWADLGLLDFRQQDYDGAFQSFSKAQALTPDSSRIEAGLGEIESRRGKTNEAIAHLKRAVALDAGNLKALYALADETDRQNAANSDADAERMLEQIFQTQPNNIAVWIDVARLAAKRDDAATLRRAVAALTRASSSWPAAALQQLAELETLARGDNVRSAAVQVQFLRNVLVRVPAYRQSLDEVKTPATAGGEPFLHFLKLPSPSSEPSEPDMALKFETRPVNGVSAALWAGIFLADSDANAEVLWADAKMLHAGMKVELPLPGQSAEASLASHAVAFADLNYDFKTDLIVATGHGLKIYLQNSPESFSDATASAKLPREIETGSYTGVWAFDYDLDGDLDLVLGVKSGEPVVLRNNGDGTFTVVKPFHGIDGMTDFVSADVDGDGDADVAILDGNGRVHVFANERLGDYRLRNVPGTLNTHALALAAGDVSGHGLPDFVVLQADGQVVRLSDRDQGRSFEVAQIAKTNATDRGNVLLADLDNNGAIDIVAGNQPFLSSSQGFKTLTSFAGQAIGFVEQSNGRLNPIELTSDGRAFESVNSGSKKYRWQDVRPRAATTHGDQRINSFGIGGQIQIRSDLLTELQIIQSPLVHFGLGDHAAAQFARILWPNGLIQTEFSPKPDQTLAADQRLKGSCPLLYAWNGSHMAFVKDVAPMSGALGAHDGSGQFASIEQTEEWFKIPGKDLMARNGYYDLRITDEYWEAYFIDRYALTAIDHPQNTQVLIDERVTSPPAPLRMYVAGPSQVFASAYDERGRDVSGDIAELDGKYLDTFPLGSYQGIAQDHWLELSLPKSASIKGPIYLVAEGWLHPWDDGILVAAHQAKQHRFEDLQVQVPDRRGKWQTVAQHLGVPAGRNKAIVLDMSHWFIPGAERKLRLRTNLEIYWDRVSWAVGQSDELVKTTILPLSQAQLQARGFSTIEKSAGRSPELPEYDQLSATGNQWAGIEGYYTRFGDVLPLLSASDGRYVIAGSGDELRLRFPEIKPTSSGTIRDFIFTGDGWMKEGDYSFAHSKSLLPLPYRGMRRYDGPSAELEQDRAYQKNVADWRNYHTRYIAPETFSAELWKK